MLMTDIEKFEKVQRLSVAYEKTRILLESQPVTRDLHPGSDIASGWTIIIAAYSGLEQVIKYLIAEENSCTIQELLCNQGQSRNGKNKGHSYLTHNLASLFHYLKKETKAIIREYYSQYQSLHSYITFETVDGFLSEVSRGDGKGYERWRYTLIEEEKLLPQNSAEAMLAIWGICVQIAESRINGIQCVRMLDETLRIELSDELFEKFQETDIEIQINSQNVDQQLLDLGREAYTRIFLQSYDPLNVFAEILQHFGNYKSHGISGLPDYVSKAVYIWIESISNFNENSGLSSRRLFIERALGNTWAGEGIRWNSESKRFDNVSWSLELLKDNTLPLDTIAIKHPNCLQILKETATECGYTIRENRECTNPIYLDTDFYFRTLEVSEPNTLEPVITVWQKPGYTIDYSFAIEQTPNKIEKPVQEWIEFNRVLANVGGFKEVV